MAEKTRGSQKSFEIERKELSLRTACGRLLPSLAWGQIAVSPVKLTEFYDLFIGVATELKTLNFSHLHDLDSHDFWPKIRWFFQLFCYLVGKHPHLKGLWMRKK